MTPHNDSSHWANRQERTVLWGIRFLLGIHRFLGRIPFLIVLGPVILFYWLNDSKLRTASREYLDNAYHHGLLKTKPNAWMSLQHLMRFAETILDKMVALSGKNVENFVRVEGDDYLRKLVDKRQGAVILTSHMGCIEALQAYGNRFQDIPIYILVHTLHSQAFNAFLDEINPLNHLRFVEVSNITPAFTFAMHDAIEQGALLFIAGDRIPVNSDATTDVTFLGKKATLPIGGPVLANLFHCPLIQMTCIRDNQTNHQGLKKYNRYRVRFNILSQSVRLNRRERQKDIQSLMQAFANELEWALAESPYDWFNFYPFWQHHRQCTKGFKDE